jgi:superfamily II DNA helicase RecQ
LAIRDELSAIVFNEAHNLDRSVVSFRSFEPVRNMFGILAQSSIPVHCPAIFMSATMRHPDNILDFCGLPSSMDAQLTMSPMRDNLEFQLQLLQGSSSGVSHQNIIGAAVQAIKTKAACGRAVVFVMYKHQVDEVANAVRTHFPDRTVIEYDQERRPDVCNLDPTAIVVATSALKTGTNMSETNLVLLFGCAYHLEDWLQAAGRAGRCEGSQVNLSELFDTCDHQLTHCQGIAIMLCTPYSLDTALRAARKDEDAAAAEARIQEASWTEVKLIQVTMY